MIKLVFTLVALACHTAQADNSFVSFFNNFDSLSGEFKQETYDENQTLISYGSGTWRFKKPKQLFWHTYKPSEQILLINNHEIWLIDMDLEQAALQNINVDKTPLYWLINKPSANSAATLIRQEQGLDWYRVEHPDNQQVFEFGFRGDLLEAIQTNNVLGQTVKIYLHSLLINPTFSANDFKLDIAPSFDIIQ